MDDESEIINEANSRLQEVFSAQAQEVTRLVTTTVKGETRSSSTFYSSLISSQNSILE